MTRVGGSYSKAVYLNNGVVQRSCLGPLLFLVYTNDVTGILPDGCVCKLYADDIKLYSTMKLLIIMITSRVALISCAWQLSISYKKCSFMVVSKSNKKLS